MEGLTRVNVSATTMEGPVVVLEFTWPPPSVIEAAEWAMVNGVTFYFGHRIGGQKTGAMLITDIDLGHSNIDTTVFGGRPSHIAGGISSMKIRGYLRS